jgi:hypothetical protein
MNNPETLATLGYKEWTIQRHWPHWAKDTERSQIKHKNKHNTENENDEQHGHHQHLGVNQWAR